MVSTVCSSARSPGTHARPPDAPSVPAAGHRPRRQPRHNPGGRATIGPPRCPGGGPAPQLPRLKALRQRAGLSQRQLAARAGLTHSTVAFLETGRHAALPSTVCKLATAFGIEPEELTGPGAAGHGGARVLVVTPDPELAALVREALEPEGLAVDWARGPGAAAVRVAQWPPDLVLLDVEHASLGELGEALARAAAPGTPVLLLVGPRRPTLAGRARLVGAVPKPFAVEDLAAAVRKAVGPSRR